MAEQNGQAVQAEQVIPGFLILPGEGKTNGTTVPLDAVRQVIPDPNSPANRTQVRFQIETGNPCKVQTVPLSYQQMLDLLERSARKARTIANVTVTTPPITVPAAEVRVELGTAAAVVAAAVREAMDVPKQDPARVEVEPTAGKRRG